jgi:para-aminobenzoate synthetase
MKPPELYIFEKIEALYAELARPVVVALDGGSGSGKSTIAAKLAKLTDIALVPLDDFYQTQVPESKWPQKTVAERLNNVFEWGRVRQAIEPLRKGEAGRWRAFDFMQGLGPDGTYSLKDEFTEVAPAPTILLEGAYSASPFLRDLIDLAVVVDVPTKVRHERAAAREQGGDDFLAAWHAVWDDVESYYFENVCPQRSFDLVIQN